MFAAVGSLRQTPGGAFLRLATPVIYASLMIGALVVLTLVMAILQWQRNRRHQTLRRLLDSTDALEAVLHQTRERMAAMKQVVGRVAPDISEAARASLDADQPVQQGLKHVLEHRLWIARNVESATLDQLEQALSAMDRSRLQIAERLAQLERTGAELAEATRDNDELLAREPPALKRGIRQND